MTGAPEDLGLRRRSGSSASPTSRTATSTKARWPGTDVLVARKGQVVFRDTYGMADIEAGKKIDDDTIFRIFSMTKPIASIALMQLVEKGEVLLHNPVCRYIPSFRTRASTPAGEPRTTRPKTASVR